MLRAYPPEPRAEDQKLRWTKTCETLKYRYHIENEYQLEDISSKAYSSLHHAVSENAKLTEVVDRLISLRLLLLLNTQLFMTRRRQLLTFATTR